jgi:4-hydroxy-tetrahydrodipicolinate reductase
MPPRRDPVLQTGNTSLGVGLLARLVREAALRLDSEWDIEIVEMHHRNKVDAPSGTALMLGEAAARGRGTTLSRSRRAPPAPGLPARAPRARSAWRRCAADRWSAITA